MAGQFVLRERGVERGYGSARARAEQSGERGEVRGRRKGKDLTRGPGLSAAVTGTHGLSAGGKRESRGWAGLIAGPAQKKRKEMGRGGVSTGWAREEDWAGFGFGFLVSFSISIFLFQTLLKPN